MVGFQDERDYSAQVDGMIPWSTSISALKVSRLIVAAPNRIQTLDLFEEVAKELIRQHLLQLQLRWFHLVEINCRSRRYDGI
jgi:hypothetical protein